MKTKKITYIILIALIAIGIGSYIILTKKSAKTIPVETQTTQTQTSIIYKKLFGLIIHRIVLANDEPRGAWKTLLDSGFGGGNALVSRLRRDPISASDSDFQFWRCVLDEVRMYFGQNPQDFDE